MRRGFESKQSYVGTKRTKLAYQLMRRAGCNSPMIVKSWRVISRSWLVLSNACSVRAADHRCGFLHTGDRQTCDCAICKSDLRRAARRISYVRRYERAYKPGDSFAFATRLIHVRPQAPAR